MTRLMRDACGLVLAVLCFACAAMGQSETATISGLITDDTGAVVPGAEVKLQSVERGTVGSATTNNSGIYVFASVHAGQYQITVHKPGFKQVDLLGMIVNVQDHIEQNFRLQVGSVSESVTVNANDLHLNTTDASVSTVVDRNFVENMPLNGRSFQSLLTLAPGVTAVPNYAGQTGAGYSGEITVNGQRTEANYFTVDGVSANTGAPVGLISFGAGAGFAGSVPGESAVGSTQSLVSIDALQEFRATTSTYSAEYGRTPGGQFSFTTRPGSNTWHGSAYDYLRNDAMDANNWFNNAAIPRVKQQERQNDFGGTLGGPIWIPGLYNGKDKTFFFFSYEGLRLVTPQPVKPVFVPDAALRKNAPAALQPFLNAFPVPNGGEDGLNDGQAFYNEAVSNPSSLDSVSVRIDHSFGDKFKIFGRYGDTPSEASSYLSSSKLTTSANVHTLTIGATNVITMRQSNELRFNITQNSGSFAEQSTNLGGATPLNLSSLPGPNGGAFPTQGSSFIFFLYYGGFPSLALQQGTRNAQRQYNVTDTYSWAVGSHNLRFGVDWRRLATRIIPSLLSEAGFFFSEASVLANSADFGVVSSQASKPVEPVYSNFSGFVQDDWKTTRRLSLSLGLRWDVNPPPSNAIGPSPYTVTQINNLATTQLAPQGTPLWKTDWHSFAPRLGIAYQLRQAPGQETVVRAGFGMFYDTGNPNGTYGFAGVGFASQAFFPGVPFPLTAAQLQLPTPSVAPPYNGYVYAFDPNLRLPYTLQWNLAVEQALGSNQTLTLGYVGSGGRKLLTDFPYLPANLGNPNFSANNQLLLTTNRASSDYHALQLRYQARLTHGLQALASYTWSHSIDDASKNFQIFEGLLRASSDFDVRHNFQAAVTYDVPGSYSNPVLSAILTHWGLDTRISARSALPVDIVGASSINPVTQQQQNFHPNLVPGQPIYVRSLQTCPATASVTSPLAAPGARLINLCAFTAAPDGIEGNVPRNFARGFDAVQADLALRRDFPIHEQLRLQFRAEAFNVFNHANFGDINNQLSLGPTQFGYAFDTLNSQLGGLSALYQVGGPRSIQVSLKLIF